MFRPDRAILVIVKGLTVVIVLCLAILAIMIALAIQRQDIRLFSVQSGSMEPRIRTGDAVLVKKVNVDGLGVGDVISYRTAETGSYTTHRIQALQPDKGQIITKGDANTWADGAVADHQVAGQAIAIAPYAGRITDLIRQPTGLILFVYVPITGLVLYEALRLQQQLRKPYRLVR